MAAFLLFVFTIPNHGQGPLPSFAHFMTQSKGYIPTIVVGAGLMGLIPTLVFYRCFATISKEKVEEMLKKTTEELDRKIQDQTGVYSRVMQEQMSEIDPETQKNQKAALQKAREANPSFTETKTDHEKEVEKHNEELEARQKNAKEELDELQNLRKRFEDFPVEVDLKE